MPDFYDVIADGSPLYLTSIPNQRGSDLPIRWMYAKSAGDVGQFVAKHDGPVSEEQLRGYLAKVLP